MRIGIDVQTLAGPHRTGLYFHSLHFARALSRLNGRHQYLGFFAGSPDRDALARVRREIPDLPFHHFRFPGRPYNLRMRLSALGRLSVFQYINSAVIPVSTARVNSFFIPDLTTVLFPEWHLPGVRAHWQGLLDQAREHGDLVVTCSDHTRQDIETHLGISPDRIAVVPLAAGEEFTPTDAAGTDRRTLAAWGLAPGRYILSVGTLEPRKNHVRLIEAYRRLKDRGVTEGRPLVLAGTPGWMYDSVLEAIRTFGLEGDVCLLGHAGPLTALYRGASVMVYPSLYEGFGLPPLEAMASGTPVVTSNTSSLPEVVGDAGLMVDPRDPDRLAEAMTRVLTDATLRSRMSLDGLARAASFSWNRTARETEAAYERAVTLKRR